MGGGKQSRAAGGKGDGSEGGGGEGATSATRAHGEFIVLCAVGCPGHPNAWDGALYSPRRWALDGACYCRTFVLFRRPCSGAAAMLLHVHLLSAVGAGEPAALRVLIPLERALISDF